MKYIIYCRKSSESDERQVQSLGDQKDTLLPFVENRGLEIIGEPLEESMSAKSPGRPLFDQMISLIEKGEVNGIVLLNPSRLSRNTVDTGRIIYLMDQGKLEEVITPYQTFKNNPYDKFMLNLLCTQAKLENDNKSVNVRDSLRLKAERGDFPGKARPGYMNNPQKTQGLRGITAHPIYFPLMRKLVDFALTGNYSVQTLVKKAEELGIRNMKGKLIAKSSLHTLLKDPFYTGKFIYNGKLYKGNHPPLMNDEEFNLLQDILEGRSHPRKQRHEAALTGIIKCGECHYCITAEFKIKHYKNGTDQTFTYYRCTKKSKEIKCTQPYTPLKDLEEQVIGELSKFELDNEFKNWAFEVLDELKEKDTEVNQDSLKALQTALDGVNKRINNLVELKISPNNSDGSLLSDDEFSDRKAALAKEKEGILKKLNELTNPDNKSWIEIARDSFNFALEAKNKFINGSIEDKNTIIKILGSDLNILYQKLSFQPQELFFKYKGMINEIKQKIEPLGPKISLQQQANLKFLVKNQILYCRKGSYCALACKQAVRSGEAG